jgi:hypothetical protein
MIAPRVEPLAVVVEAHSVALVVVRYVDVVGIDLEAPDRHGVVNADVPGRLDRQIRVDRDVADAALLLGEEHLLAPVRAEDGRLEAAVVLLVDQGVRSLLAEDARVFDALLLDRSLGHGARDVDGQHLGEPVVARPGHVEHRLGVVASAGRGDEQGPAAVLDHDRREIGPGGGVREGRRANVALDRGVSGLKPCRPTHRNSTSAPSPSSLTSPFHGVALDSIESSAISGGI